MENFNPLNIPVIGYMRAVLGVHFTQFRAAREDGDRGASAIELAIITAILVGLAVAVLLIVTQVVNRRKAQITGNNNGIP
jgi:hypothetical protein